MGSLGISEGNITRRKHTHTHTEIMHLIATPSREVAQMLVSATRKQGMNRKARAALFQVRTGPQCPEENLRELTLDSNPNHGVARVRERKRE